MIIDAHAHIWPGIFWPAWDEEIVIRHKADLIDVSVEEARLTTDPVGDGLVEEMNRGGVDVTVIVTIDYGPGMPGGKSASTAPVEQQWEGTAEAVKKHPGRLLWGAGIDPRRPEAIRLMERAVMRLGARVIKLHPPSGFYPNDEALCYPVYKKAIEMGVPVHVHTAPATEPGFRSKFCHPIYLEDVAVDFPGLKIQAVHSGGAPWWDDMLAVAKGRPNVYLDVGAWQADFGRHTLQYYRRVREMFDVVGPRRVMWASDWIGPSALPQASWLKYFQEIPESVKEAGIEFTDEEMKAFLGETAREFLGLSEE